MKSIKHVTAIVFLAIIITSFTSCDRIGGFISHQEPTEDTVKGGAPNTLVDSISTESTPKEDPLAQVRIDSLARVGAIQQEKAKKIEDELDSLTKSINDLNSKIDNLENKSENMMDRSSTYTFIVVEFVLSLLIMLSIYRIVNNQIKKIKRQQEKQEGDMSEDCIDNRIREAIKDLAKQINEKNSKQDELVDKIGRRLSKLEGQNCASFQQPQEESPKNEELKRDDIFYMPRTRTELQFDDNKKKFVKDETTYFKFNVKKGGKAEFTFDPPEGNIIGAYDDRENSLVTACVIEAKSKTPTKFKNIKPGEAELKGNIWAVTRKLILEYV